MVGWGIGIVVIAGIVVYVWDDVFIVSEVIVGIVVSIWDVVFFVSEVERIDVGTMVSELKFVSGVEDIEVGTEISDENIVSGIEGIDVGFVNIIVSFKVVEFEGFKFLFWIIFFITPYIIDALVIIAVNIIAKIAPILIFYIFNNKFYSFNNIYQI